MIQVAEEPISPQGVLPGLKIASSGSIVFHIGVVRPFSEGKKVGSIEYQIKKKEGEEDEKKEDRKETAKAKD